MVPLAVSEVTKLFDERQIERRVHELAADIAKTMPAEFTVVALLKGSFVFAADLVRALDGVGLAPRVEFLQLSSYGRGQESSGQVRLIGEVPEVEGRRVLVVDDITDSGAPRRLLAGLQGLRGRRRLRRRLRDRFRGGPSSSAVHRQDRVGGVGMQLFPAK
jgi:hypoxanthine phosphoribosyltransferase